MTVISESLDLQASTFISYVLYLYFRKNECPHSLCRKLLDVYRENHRSLLRNKVLTPVSQIILDCCKYSDEIVDFRLKRFRIYMESCKELADRLAKNGVRYAIIKTIKPIPADIADIDVLVHDKEKNAARRTLEELGYKLRKVSESQELWTKIRDGIVVDIELHTKVAASNFVYIDNDIILNNLAEREGIAIPKEWLNILIDSAHAVIKDLEVKLADILEIYFFMNKLNDSKELLWYLLEVSRGLGLNNVVKFMLSVAEIIKTPYDDTDNQWSNNSLRRMLVKGIDKLPIKPPLFVIAASVYELLLNKMITKGVYTSLKEILSIFRTKGADAIIAYLFGGAVTKDLFEDLVVAGDT